MPANSPEELQQQIVAAVCAGDADAAAALYEPGASMVPEPGTTVTGAEAIREALGAFAAMAPTMTVETTSLVRTGDIALLLEKWTLSGTGPDGSDVNMAGTGSAVMRRQADGTWKYLIDNPFAG